MQNPIIDLFQERILMAQAGLQPLRIVGGNTKYWYGNVVEGDDLSTQMYRGVLEYQPAESIITVRSGTPVTEVQALLALHGQTLGFDVPFQEEGATIGGMVAAGLTGSSRPFKGAIKDYVLGMRVLNAKGKVLQLGGKVMKNVAGYDITHLYVGSQGTLGVILDVTFRVVTLPEKEITVQLNKTSEQLIPFLVSLKNKPYPISAAFWTAKDAVCSVRMTGSAAAVDLAYQHIGGDVLAENLHLKMWQQPYPDLWPLKHPTEQILRCVQVPANVPVRHQDKDAWIDWGGMLRWSIIDPDSPCIREDIQQLKGTVAYFGSASRFAEQCFHPLSKSNQYIQVRIKECFDPSKILNPKRLYSYV